MSRAFTLIEVMVVLSVLAIIAILTYNFFGNTMRDAAVSSLAQQVYKQSETLEYAIETYRRDVSDFIPPRLPKATQVAMFVDTGILREAALPSEDVWSGSNITNFEWTFSSTCNRGGSASADTYLKLVEVNYDVCKKYNEMFAGGTEPTAVVNTPCAAAPEYRSNICYYFRSPDGFVVAKLYEYN